MYLEISTKTILRKDEYNNDFHIKDTQKYTKIMKNHSSIISLMETYTTIHHG